MDESGLSKPDGDDDKSDDGASAAQKQSKEQQLAGLLPSGQADQANQM